MSWQQRWIKSERRALERSRHPARTLALLFFFLIFFGGLALQLPIASRAGALDAGSAYFTATSAVCVTGLSVIDPAEKLSRFGQCVLLLLIQLGGLGYMTAATLLVIFLRREPDLHDRTLFRSALGQLSLRDTVKLVWQALVFTLAIETVGALILALRLGHKLGIDKGEALWLGVFHSVSAFCNAGFDLMSPYGSASLSALRADGVINGTVVALITVGSLGFLVCRELMSYRKGARLSVHVRVVLSVTAGLTLFGTLVLLITEWTNPGTLGPLPVGEKCLAAFFQTVTTRTAGFATVDVGNMRSVSLVVMGLLMFVGGSPGSTAGGVKTTTFAAMLLAIRAALKGWPDVEVFNRRLPPEQVHQALVLIGLFTISLFLGGLILVFTEPVALQIAGFRTNLFMRIEFEALSALATVGLSTGITSSLTPIGRLVLMVLMFLGRLGPLTVAAAIAAPGPPPRRRLPEEEVPFG